MAWMGGGVVVALGGVAGGACAWGSLLPVEHLAGSQAVIPASPEQVWATIEDVDAYPTWREDVRAIAWPEPPGEADPARRVWVERSSSGDIPFTVVATDPPRRRVTEIAADDLGFGGRWVFDLEWVEPGTRVRIVEEGRIPNPLFRWMTRYAFGYHGTLDAFLVDLGARYGATVVPEHLSFDPAAPG